MWIHNVLTPFLLTFIVYNVVDASDPKSVEDLLKEVTSDKENHNLVDDIAHFVVNKIQEGSEAVGADGVLDPVKLQEYVTIALAKGTEWLTEKTGSLYNRIRDRVSHWWNGMNTKGVAPGSKQEDVSEEVKKEVLKTILTKIEEELKAKNITGIAGKDLEEWVLPMVKKMFDDLFGFPVKPNEKP